MTVKMTLVFFQGIMKLDVEKGIKLSFPSNSESVKHFVCLLMKSSGNKTDFSVSPHVA